ncbi:MAG: hypothetical protein M1495_14820 [Bacteroidetes bacterium]|nr:hypothetical protein [Bacteroidota bacterium]
MKKIILILFVITANIIAQDYTVKKISGNVQALIGTSENWVKVSAGQKLKGTDLISTGEKSFIQLSGNGNKFVLQSNSALGLSSIKKMTLNELLLALAMEEIQNVPKTKSNQFTRNTAVYGSEVSTIKPAPVQVSDIGIKKINGAKQLAQDGFKESAILVAKETFRKYPDTKKQIQDRIYFADLMIRMNLNNEAEQELKQISSLSLNSDEKKEVDEKIEQIKKINLDK